MNLQAYREAVLSDAGARASAVLGEADRTAGATVRSAKEDHGRQIAEARAAGESSADAELRRRRVRAGREARERILAVQREVLDRLRAEALALLREQAEPEGRAPATDRLVALARSQLGEEATISVDARGAIIAERDGRRVDYSLEAMVDRCIERLGAELTRLWA